MNIGSGWGGHGVGVRGVDRNTPSCFMLQKLAEALLVHYSTNLALLPNCDVLLLKTKLKEKSIT